MRGENRIVPPPQQKKRSYDSEISKRKNCTQVMRVNKDLKDLNPTDLDFLQGTLRLFGNDSLCPYYRGLWNECKKLWSIKKN